MMKKCENIEQLRKILRNIINTQSRDEINNFNSLYDYSSITNMSYLWEKIEEIIIRREELGKYLKKDWKNIKFPTINMKNVKLREEIFRNCPLYEINLINTYNIEGFSDRFYETKNLEKMNLDLKNCINRSFIFSESGVKKVELLNTQNIKYFSKRFSKTENLVEINSLYLNNCKSMEQTFESSNIKKLNLYNTGKVKYWNETFVNSKVEEISLDMRSRENCVSMFLNCNKLKYLNLKNCENIKTKWNFLQGCKRIKYLEMNLTNVEDASNFINENNDIKYLKLIGMEEYGGENVNIEKDFNEIFFNEEISQHYKNNPIPHIELKKKSSVFNIIGDNNLEIRLEKKEKKEKMINIKKEKQEKLKSQKKYNLEINL